MKIRTMATGLVVGACVFAPTKAASEPPLPRSPAEVIGISPDGRSSSDLRKDGVGLVALNYSPLDFEKGGKLTNNRSQFHYSQELRRNGISQIGIIAGTRAVSRMPECADRTYCAPKDQKDTKAFAGLIAKNYPWIKTFVIGNEVNSAEWFDIGCRDNCDPEAWVKEYIDYFGANYETIKKTIPDAKLLVPFNNFAGRELDKPYFGESSLVKYEWAVVSMFSFLDSLVAKGFFDEFPDVGIAPHIYPKDLGSLDFSADDYPYLTPGNIDIIAGMLRDRYPSYPQLAEFYATEQGLSSARSEEEQAKAICDLIRLSLGSRAVKLVIYHRLEDHPIEAEDGVKFGLIATDGRFKPSYRLFLAALNEKACGSENYPYVTALDGTVWRR